MIDPSLLNLLPPLRRARGDRLYGPDERHWVDLWKQDGTWLLGRRPEGAAKEWKVQLDKGLAGWAPSLWPDRLLSQVQKLVAGVTAVRVFRNVDRAPVVPLWRPWDDQPLPSEAPGFAGAFRLVLPTGPAQAVAVAYTEAYAGAVPDHDVTAPAEAAALVHAAAQLVRFTADVRAVAARLAASAAFDKLIAPAGRFVRQGVWFQAVAGDYRRLFEAHLAAGFLLPPDPEGWGVLSPDLSPGEWAAWAAVVRGPEGGV
jgi:hypothetical protein